MPLPVNNPGASICCITTSAAPRLLHPAAERAAATPSTCYTQNCSIRHPQLRHLRYIRPPSQQVTTVYSVFFVDAFFSIRLFLSFLRFYAKSRPSFFSFSSSFFLLIFPFPAHLPFLCCFPFFLLLKQYRRSLMRLIKPSFTLRRK